MQNAKCKMQNELSGEPQPNPELPADDASAFAKATADKDSRR
jgi:hypothetical protein